MATQQKPAPAATGTSTPTPATRKRVSRITSRNLKSMAVGIEHAIAIAGIVHAVKMKPDPVDPARVYPAFMGDFRAKVGNSVLVSDELSLPSIAEAALKAAHEKNGEDAVTTFSISIHKEKDDTSPRGFKWAHKEIRPTAVVTSENDPVMKLFA